MRSILIFLMLALLAGCGSSGTPAPTTAASDAATASPQSTRVLPTPRPRPDDAVTPSVAAAAADPAQCREEASDYLQAQRALGEEWSEVRWQVLDAPPETFTEEYRPQLEALVEQATALEPPACAAEVNALFIASMEADMQVFQLIADGAPESELDAAEARLTEIIQDYNDVLDAAVGPEQ